MMEPSAEIIVDDVFKGLAYLADSQFDCVPTSPPYWGQRDYGFEGQIGMEKTLAEHIQKLVEVFREIRRVLKPTGVVWLNYGDNFASAVNGRSAADTKAAGNDDRTHRDKPMTGMGETGLQGFGVIKNGDLIGAPWALAFALRADGWYLRQCNIWSKPNPKPESAKNRPSTSHEYIFMLTKSRQYFFDMEAVKEPAASASRKDIKARKRTPSHAPGHAPEGVPFAASSKRHLRSVWNIKVQPFPEAHFATFPENLAEIMIRASCSEGGCCATCGMPALRVTEKGEPDREWQKACGGDDNGDYSGESTKDYAAAGPAVESASDLKRRVLAGMVTRTTIGWKRTCSCPPYPNVRPLVLDPFGGSGTVGLVATQLGCDAVLIEANPEYAEIALRRITESPPTRPVKSNLEVNIKGAEEEEAGKCQTLETTPNAEALESAKSPSRSARAITKRQSPSHRSKAAPKKKVFRKTAQKKKPAKKRKR